ncbi:4-hydroxy-tetrahydrodipicolinate synthase [uncultured Roseovarius sp.]|uniref:4-hydroxy-tetrahydrodipicolinate synthase n=1 Tax=uncultured Roseovarius sp. TaxID=293344 RepID=UPI002609CC5E|nr:4-hydroxy-tetrahydrodipicolinate synthase [uncultured Roseovarius sp.]
MFKGSITALITPFVDGVIDETALRRLVDWQIDEGSHGLVACGTTGESPTLSTAEHKKVTEIVIEAAADRVPVMASAGSNTTAESMDYARHAQEAGADGLLVVTPYYNKPNQEGLYRHFKAVAESTHLPITIYNIPPRSVVDVSVETMAKLFRDCPTITGVKDATMNLARPSQERMVCGLDFELFSGEDGTALGYMAHGGRGCISVTANVAPKLCATFQEACLIGDFGTALRIQDRLMPLHEALFLDPNPAGVKYALSRMGLAANELRSPLFPASPKAREAIDTAITKLGLIK